MHLVPAFAILLATVATWDLSAQSPDRANPDPSHWAFVAPRAVAVPEVQDETWSRQAVDRFVLHQLERTNDRPSPRADKRTLIRRVTLDLTGLPPTREEIRAFVDDPSDDAYERLVDRLLASPHYGEHMARYWLDLVRFADTNGIHHDHYRDLTPYRDWVIRSFNDNLPYDRFVVDQLAGDLHPEPTLDQQIASGFHRLHLIIDRGTALPEESLARNVIDRVTAVGTAFMGLTVQCALCHDHKYDPITQRDFFGLYAFFNNLDADPETGARGTTDFRRGLQPPYVDLPTRDQAATLARLDRELQAVAATRTELEEAKAAPAELERVNTAEQRLRREHTETLLEVRAAMVMKERADVRPTHVFVRGNYAEHGPEVERGTPAFLPPLPPTAGTRSRMDLARWLVSAEHPLTARVAVNRFWQQFFGVGIVKTPDDLGTQGERPSHPGLLDYLATQFVASGWDVKALARRIVLSETYRQSSVGSPEAFARDPDNRRLARGSRFRMDAEMIRDQVLATSGWLEPTLFGKSVKPPQPEGIWKAVTLPDSLPRTYTPDRGDKTRRRSIYTFWKRGMPPPQMSILNAPTRESCTARRERTNTPLQALLLLNEAEYLKAARHLARQLLLDDALSAAARVEVLYETITSQLPDAQERDALLRCAADLQAMYEREPSLAAQLCEGVSPEDSRPHAQLAAWTMLASTIYNLDVTKTRQ